MLPVPKFMAVRALVVLMLCLGTGGCASMKVDPNHPTQDQQTAKLLELAKLADAAVKVESLARSLQDAEIAAFDSHAITGFGMDRHKVNQKAFKEFFELSRTALLTAKDVSNPADTRRDAVNSVVTGADTLLNQVGLGGASPAFDAMFAAVKAAVLALNLAV